MATFFPPSNHLSEGTLGWFEVYVYVLCVNRQHAFRHPPAVVVVAVGVHYALE